MYGLTELIGADNFYDYVEDVVEVRRVSGPISGSVGRLGVCRAAARLIADVVAADAGGASGAGIEARARLPAGGACRLEAGPDRPDPIALLEGQAAIAHPGARAGPLRPDGGLAVHVLSRRGPADGGRPRRRRRRPAFQVQLCGDAHLSNFGLFASPERDLVFDINDFDETHPGPWEWDVKRLAGSLVRRRPGARLRRPRGAPRVHAAVRSYRERMAEYAAMRAIDVYYAKVDAAAIDGYVDKRARPYLAIDRQVGRPSRRSPRAAEADRGRRDGPAPDRRPSADHHPPARHDAAARGCGPRDAYRDTLQEDRRVLLDRYQLIDARAQGGRGRQRRSRCLRRPPRGGRRATIRSSSRRRRPRRRSSSVSSVRAPMGRTASESSPASAGSRRPAT